MSLNTAHTSTGVLLHSGETILIYSSQVSIEISGQNDEQFQASKTGKLYLTTHRMVFNNKDKEDPLKSFSFPFIAPSASFAYIQQNNYIAKFSNLNVC